MKTIFYAFILYILLVRTQTLIHQAMPTASQAASIVAKNLHTFISTLDGYRYKIQNYTRYTRTSDTWQSLKSTYPISRGLITQVISKIIKGNNAAFGFSVDPTNLHTQFLGQTQNSWSWYCYDGNKYHRNTAIPFAQKCGAGDTIKVVFDMRQDKGTVQYFLNGKSLGVAWLGLTGMKDDIYYAFSTYYTTQSIQLLQYNIRETPV